MAAQTGSTYISGTTIDSVEIPTAKRGFSTMTSSKCLPLSATTTDRRQPEMMLLLLALVTIVSTDDGTV